jgi:hypothetical protein
MAVGVDGRTGKLADAAVEADMRQARPEGGSGLLEGAVPAPTPDWQSPM